jgi:hypothetical protein
VVSGPSAAKFAGFEMVIVELEWVRTTERWRCATSTSDPFTATTDNQDSLPLHSTLGSGSLSRYRSPSYRARQTPPMPPSYTFCTHVGAPAGRQMGNFTTWPKS